jgi:pyruvate,water dikinase
MDVVRSFGELSQEELPFAGGKGATLARLYRAGYPVPEGHVVLPAAFEGDDLAVEAWIQVRARVACMRRQDSAMAFAVRSSALCEDSAQASYAGGFETVLGVRTDNDVREAICAVRRSHHGERVRAYSEAHGIGGSHELAVIVQRLIPADVSGVLFTVDPVTGSRACVRGNYCRGAGEELVSGEANPQVFCLRRPAGSYEGPPEIARYARRLFRLARRLERDLGGPQDIEWAIAGGKLYLLQSRPITTLRAYEPATGEWNHSRTGDYLWTNANFGEAFPDVLTPFTWSVAEVFVRSNGVGMMRYPYVGNIAGRLYMNLSLGLSMIEALGLPQSRAIRAQAETFGRIPEGIEIPTIPFSRAEALRLLVPVLFRQRRLYAGLVRRIPAFVAEAPALAENLAAGIRSARTPEALLALWRSRLDAHLEESCRVLYAGLSEYRRLSRQLHVEFEELLGEADANALLSGVSSATDQLASLGLLAGLIRISRGEMSREEYLRRYGHRGPHEMELSIPRPVEDPAWLDRRLAEVADSPIDVSALVEEQRLCHRQAWERLRRRVGRRAGSYRRRLDRLAAASRKREASRSAAVRFLGVLRAFALRAGELAGLGDDVFFLSLDEVVEVLAGNRSVAAFIPARREIHVRHSALPPYPGLIRGRFDPFRWAEDPDRRSDLFDAWARVPLASGSEGRVVTGFTGAAGRVEGVVRRLHSEEEGRMLRAGEVLVTRATNVGWTPLFSRAAAIVTDVGAPFSHAAIVARELGIPAVVGCGDATMRLHTGDRVVVHGGQGVVELLERGER